jgi:hypothetical protein
MRSAQILLKFSARATKSGSVIVTNIVGLGRSDGPVSRPSRCLQEVKRRAPWQIALITSGCCARRKGWTSCYRFSQRDSLAGDDALSEQSHATSPVRAGQPSRSKCFLFSHRYVSPPARRVEAGCESPASALDKPNRGTAAKKRPKDGLLYIEYLPLETLGRADCHGCQPALRCHLVERPGYTPKIKR